MNKIDFNKNEVYTDGKLTGIYLGMTIDGSEPTSSYFDPVEFVAATVGISRCINTFFFTCSCGVAGCAGIFHGIHVKYRRHTVEWRDKDKPRNLKQRYYVFDKNEYRAAIAKCTTLMFEIAKEQDAIHKELIASNDDIEEYYHRYDGSVGNVPGTSESMILSSIQYRQNWLRNHCLL